jgi:lytic murein transglycosylase
LNHLSYRTPIVIASLLLLPTAAHAAKCGGDFQGFLAQMARDAQAQGLRADVVQGAFAGLTVDQKVLEFDRRQRGTFRKSFEEYVATRVGASRVKRGRDMLARHAALFARLEKQFGVPKELITAIWGLESDYGSGDMGKLPVVRTIATMALDCRRTELFQGELIAALKILQRGDLTRETMIGAYAGELGQTQFLPSSYIKYGVDYDGNGHIDLRRSVPDVLASTSNLLKANGWQRGQPFGEGTPNFQVMREWNRSEIYRKTIVLFAEKLGANPN